LLPSTQFKTVESGSRLYVEELWKDEMQAVLLAAETGFETVRVKLNSSGKEYVMMVADTAERRKVGLSFRDDLPDGIDGMLFLYTNADIRAFTADRTHMDLYLYGFNSEGSLNCKRYLPAGHIGPFVVPDNQFTVETNKSFDVEFLELVL
jgi:hypothetical protein